MAAADWNRTKTSVMLAIGLAVVTVAVYLPVLRDGFVNYDDPEYITNNPHVNAGLTWSGMVWAFQSGQASNWHPLTWISHMLDCQFFGLQPAGHHLTNLLFHIANTVLLFFLLHRLTGARWRSAFVAALFAWHPLHVESVAWASERKDVLSAFFGLLAMMFYVRYAQSALRSPHSALRNYFLSLLLFACGLMSKPMVVTLPFVLLLLDFWPLGRFTMDDLRYTRVSTFFSSPVTRHSSLFLEKIPFFALTIAACIVTRLVQSSAVWSTPSLTFQFRLANAVMSYGRYLAKFFWPADLALIYPYPHYWPIAGVVAVALVLVACSAFALFRAKRFPYLAVGWFWYLGTLAPVIGLVQAGIQSMADRYTYLPGIGLFIIVAWGLNDLLPVGPQKAKIAATVGGLALAGCLAVTSVQLSCWRDSLALFSHTVAVTRDNYAADDCLGSVLEDLGKTDAAAKCYAEAVRVEPDFPSGQFHLGMILLGQGRGDEASNHLAAAAQFAPREPVMQFDFGLYLAQHGNPADAAGHFKAALAAKPDFPEAKQELATLLAAHPELK